MDSNLCTLQLDNIVKVYGQGENSVKALKGISLSFRKSEFVSILGPSGCGKTTLLNIIGGLDRYTSGDLMINGVSTKKYYDDDWDTYRNNSIGFVFQSYNLIPHQTVLSNVELALTLSGIGKNERIARAKEALKQVGLTGQEYKRPNQLSGGQMQRVAIARALVNNPEIILADEPTGALDTETSVQVMELLKEVAKNRLVIMVTHNPELAKKYSTRIINLLDGEVSGDSNPLENKKESDVKRERGKKKNKSAMKLFTAFSLSMSNLRTKKGRTILTSIAGSIGIIGIALVLAVSTGFSAYINKLQADTLSVYPVTISESTIDLSDFEKLANDTVSDKVLAQRVNKIVYSRDMFGDLTNMLKYNKLSNEYVNRLENFVQEENTKSKENGNDWEYCVQKNYGFDMNDYIFSNLNYTLMGHQVEKVASIDSLVEILEELFNSGLKNSDMNISAEFVREYIPTLSEMPDNQYLLQSQYELIDGEWANDKDELMLVVDKYNRISDITLVLLGYKSIESINYENLKVEFGGSEELPFSEIYDKEFYFIDNDDRYTKEAEHTYKEKSFTKDNVVSNTDNLLTMKVKGVIRLKDGVSSGILDSGIAYTSKLTDYVISQNEDSEIVADAKLGYKRTNSETGLEETVNKATIIGVENYELSIRELAGSRELNKISIYSTDYSAKERIKSYLDEWNNKDGISEEDKIHYSDSTAMLFSALNTIVDSVKIVLVCFTAISLVVSSIMIGIITYVSVVERTKEIGILRAIGARKKDISRIFNAETFLIGLLAGLIGVGVSYLLSIPINLIIAGLIEGASSIVSLKVSDALTLVAVSFVLTLIAGIIPARIAAKKDPVIALHAE